MMFFIVCSDVNQNQANLILKTKTQTLEPSGFHSVGSQYSFQNERFSYFYHFKHTQGEHFRLFSLR